MKMTDLSRSVAGQSMTAPLSLALSNLDLLCASVEENLQETVQETRRNVLRMYRAIRKYDLAEAIRTGKLRMDPEPYPAAGILERVCTPLREPAAERGVELRTAAPPGLIACCDAEAVGQVLWYLLENAVGAAQHGTRIEAAAERTEKGIRISVDAAGLRFDDGRERIETAPNASGLGLSRDLLRMQGSTLECLSREDGHAMVFVLPEGECGALRCPVPASPAVFGISEAELELSVLKSAKIRNESSD